MEEAVRSMRNGRAIRRASMDIAEIGRRREDNRESPRSKISMRIANGRSGEDLNSMMGNGGIHTECLTQNARLAGIHIWSTCKIEWDENVLDDYTEDIG